VLDPSNPIEPATSADERLGALMTRQHGLITVRQAADILVSRKMLLRRVERGLLVPGFDGRSGVYRDPAAPTTDDQRLLALVLAGGAGAFGSHESSAWSLGLPTPSSAWSLEVTTPESRRPRTKGGKYHRSHLVVPDDITRVRGVPVATAALTIIDLSARWSRAALGAAIDDAIRRRLTSVGALQIAAARLAPAPGRSKVALDALLRIRSAREGSESVLEDFVLDAIARFRLPAPERQFAFEINGRRGRIDCCYPRSKVAVEALGYEWHVRQRRRWDDDRFRGNELAIAGWTVLEFTSAFTDWQVAEHIARALRLPAPRCPKRPLDFNSWSRRIP
jgi:very-short-patch-repair endonuclease